MPRSASTSPAMSSALLLFVLALPAFTWVSDAARWRPGRAGTSSKPTRSPRATATVRNSRARSSSMYQENASTLTPDPLHSAFYDSHPPPVMRIARLAPRDSAPPTGRSVRPRRPRARDVQPPSRERAQRARQAAAEAAGRPAASSSLTDVASWFARTTTASASSARCAAASSKSSPATTSRSNRNGPRRRMDRRRAPAPPQRAEADGQPGPRRVHRRQPRPARHRRRAAPDLRPVHRRPLHGGRRLRRHRRRC